MLRSRYALLLAVAVSPSAAAPPDVLKLRTQKVGDVIYFEVTFRTPADLTMPPGVSETADLHEGTRRYLARLPRLVPQDGRTDAVALLPPTVDPPLAFVGKVRGE